MKKDNNIQGDTVFTAVRLTIKVAIILAFILYIAFFLIPDMYDAAIEFNNRSAGTK